MTATTDRAALYRGILERPDDDVARLVFADWLEENGESQRAEFVRRQVAGEDVKPSIHWFPMPSKWFTFARGFVSKVSCDLNSWIGGPCERCNTIGGVTMPTIDPATGRQCPACSGTGRTPAHGPRIVAEQPVQEVTTEKRPLESSFGFTWSRGRHRSSANDWLPDEIHAMMPPGKVSRVGGDSIRGVRVFDSEAAALAALSLALANWARREAGLPPLREHATA